MLGLFSLQGWVWAVAALSVGMRVGRFGKPLPGAVADAAMPFFLVHQPVILALAFFVVGWQAGIPVKLPVLLVLSFPVSAAAAWLLSRAAVTRRLLGVKPHRTHPPPQVTLAYAAPAPANVDRVTGCAQLGALRPSSWMVEAGRVVETWEAEACALVG
jgi:hypothetical protein